MSSRLIQLGLLSLVSSAIAIPVLPSGGFSYSDAAFSGPKGTGGVAFGTGRHHHPHGTGFVRPSKTGDLTLEALSTPTAAASTSIGADADVDAAEDGDSASSPTSNPSATSTDTQTLVTPQADAASDDSTVDDSSIDSAAASSSVPVATVAVRSYPAPAVTSTKAASAPAASSGSTVGGKRGIAYTSPAQAQPLIGKTQWAYNWGSTSGALASGVEYLPMLWSNTAEKTNSWVADATKAIANGATAVLGFNEPDHPQQANLSPQVAATAYQQYITNNFAGKAKLISPAVTNGGGSMGLTWLSTFLGLCTGCKIDAVAIHWYDVSTNIDYFKSHIQDAHTQSGLPVYLTEFGTTDGNDQAFLQAVLPWLDSQDYVQKYAYFMAEDGKLLSGSGLSAAGNTYCA